MRIVSRVGVPSSSIVSEPRRSRIEPSSTTVTPRAAISTDLEPRFEDAAVSVVGVNTVNRFAWQRWRADLTLPEKGYYEVWARATDMNGVSQPPVSPGWNPCGSAHTIQHRIALIAG